MTSTESSSLALDRLRASVPAARRGRADDLGVPSRDGLVVCTSAPACDAGAAVLAQGGNAVDAAVATAFALAVTHPSAGNIGGGGFMVVRTPTGEVDDVRLPRDGAAASRRGTMYLGATARSIAALTAAGYLAPGVPGTVRGLALAHKRFGKLPWKDVVMPAVAPRRRAASCSRRRSRAASTRELAGRDGPVPRVGRGVRQAGRRHVGRRRSARAAGPRARRCARSPTDGADVFYTGWIADRIAEDMAANGGLITKDDLAAYQAKERAPVRGTYRGYEIVSMPPPSSGGVALIEMLNILEPFDLKAKGC